MNTATKYSVSDAATLYKKSRATLYKDIKNGVLSRDHDGCIDFSELLRVYGEPFGAKQAKRIDTSSIQNQNIIDIMSKHNSVSIHIRRGDYLLDNNLSYH